MTCHRFDYLQCGDLAPLLFRGGSTPHSSMNPFKQKACDKSQPSKALTSHRTPKKSAHSK
jgi:hypothetical protein